MVDPLCNITYDIHDISICIKIIGSITFEIVENNFTNINMNFKHVIWTRYFEIINYFIIKECMELGLCLWNQLNIWNHQKGLAVLSDLLNETINTKDNFFKLKQSNSGSHFLLLTIWIQIHYFYSFKTSSSFFTI